MATTAKTISPETLQKIEEVQVFIEDFFKRMKSEAFHRDDPKDRISRVETYERIWEQISNI